MLPLSYNRENVEHVGKYDALMLDEGQESHVTDIKEPRPTQITRNATKAMGRRDLSPNEIWGRGSRAVKQISLSFQLDELSNLCYPLVMHVN